MEAGNGVEGEEHSHVACLDAVLSVERRGGTSGLAWWRGAGFVILWRGEGCVGARERFGFGVWNMVDEVGVGVPHVEIGR